MKVKILLLFIALTFLSGTGGVLSQDGKDARLQSGKNLQNALLTMIRKAKESSAKKSECDMRGLLKSIPRKNLVPSIEELKKEIGHIVDDSLTTSYSAFRKVNMEVLEAVANTTKKTDFFKKLGLNYGDMDKDRRKEADRFYYGYRKAQKTGFKIQDASFKRGECSVSVKTFLIPKKLTWDHKAFYRSDIEWQLVMDITINCSCSSKNKFKVKKASYRYTADTKGRLVFNRYDRDLARHVIYFGLRFGPIKNPVIDYTALECCKELKDPVEDGNFVDPNENINDKNTLLDTGIGLGFGSEVETNIGFSGGVLFTVAEISGNPLFIGPKATVSTTSITNEDVKELRVLVGPTAEYQIPLRDSPITLVTGINSGYLFGSLDSFGFKRDLSGVAVNSYAGVQYRLGNNVALTAILNFFEYSNLKFKSDMENFENTTSNTTFLTDGGAINVGVRIGLD